MAIRSACMSFGNEKDKAFLLWHWDAGLKWNISGVHVSHHRETTVTTFKITFYLLSWWRQISLDVVCASCVKKILHFPESIKTHFNSNCFKVFILRSLIHLESTILFGEGSKFFFNMENQLFQHHMLNNLVLSQLVCDFIFNIYRGTIYLSSRKLLRVKGNAVHIYSGTTSINLALNVPWQEKVDMPQLNRKQIHPSSASVLLGPSTGQMTPTHMGEVHLLYANLYWKQPHRHTWEECLPALCSSLLPFKSAQKLIITVSLFIYEVPTYAWSIYPVPFICLSIPMLTSLITFTLWVLPCGRTCLTLFSYLKLSPLVLNLCFFRVLTESFSTFAEITMNHMIELKRTGIITILSSPSMTMESSPLIQVSFIAFSKIIL